MNREDGFAQIVQSFGLSAGHFGYPNAGIYASAVANGEVAANLYDAGGLPALIVDRPAGDAVARGWRIEGDETSWPGDEMTRLNAQPIMEQALRLARVRGAAAVLVLTDTGRDLAQPLDLTGVGQVRGLIPFGAESITAEQQVYDDPTQPNFGEPVAFRISPARGDAFVVHESRLLRVSGDPYLPGARTLASSVPWLGRPALDASTIGALQGLIDALRWSLRLLERKQVPVYQMAGLAEALGLGDEGEATVRKRLENVDLVRSVLNSIAVDAQDKFTVTDLTLTGVSDVIRDHKVNVSTCARIPVSILFGESAKGLNATGEGDREAYNGFVGQVQNRGLRPALERLMTLLYAQKGARQPEAWHVEFEPLWLPSEKEQGEADSAKATARKTNADALVAIGSLNVLDPEELRNAAALMIPDLDIEPGSAAPEIEEPEPPPMDPSDPNFDPEAVV